MAVKNVTFEVTANTQNAQASLNALIQQLDQIKKNSTISFGGSTQQLNTQIKAVSNSFNDLSKASKESDDVVEKGTKKKKTAYEQVLSQVTKLTAKSKELGAQLILLEKGGNQNTDAYKNLSFEYDRVRQKAEKAVEALKKLDVSKGDAKKREEQTKKDASAYVQLSNSAKELTSQSKELGAQLLLLEKSGKKNTSEYIQLSREYKTVKAAADEANASLKSLNQTQSKGLTDTQKRRQEIAITQASLKEQAQVEAAAAKATKESTAYFQVSESVKTLTARSRELGAQLILLEQSGQKNSATYKALAKEYATVKAAADKASASLKQLNSNSNLQPSAQKLGGLAGAINFISQAVANSSTNFLRLRNVIARTGVALGAVSIGAAVLSFGRAAIKAASDYETLNVSFGTLIGNTTLATAKIKELRQFAAETPFTTEDVFQASRTLLGYGITAGQLIPTIQKLGDVAGGVGVPLERVALVFGQVRAAGRLYGQDLLQLVQLGFNPLSEIARTTGESFDSLKDKMRKGQITFDDVNNAFITATSEGGKFYNLTNALANTTTAQLARLNEEWTILLTQVGEGLLPAFNALIDFGRGLLEFFTNLPKTIRENAVVFTILTAATTALTAALFANSLNLVSNSVKTVFNTAAKVANRTATALMAGANVLATNGIRAQTIAQAGLTTGTKLATSAINAFKAAWATNPLGLIITLLSTAAAAWYAFSDAVDTANDNFIDADEALDELAVNSQKAASEEIKSLDVLMKTAKDATKSLKERQNAVNQINEKYKTNLKLIGDEKKDVAALTGLYLDLTEAIKQSNKEKAAGEIKAKLESQLSDIRLQILNAASDAGVAITPELILDDTEIQSGFKQTKQLIENTADSISEIGVPNQLEVWFDELVAFAPTAAQFDDPFENAFQPIANQNIIDRSNAVETLNVQLAKLIKTYGIIGAIDKEVGVTPDTAGTEGLKTQEEIDRENKERIRKLKDFEKELADLYNRIRKNNEDIRKQLIEFQFVDAADFEEEIVKLQQLDRINEETVNREIDREIEAVRQKEITEQQKTKLITQLEIIRNQEQQKRAFELQQRLYEIERDGIIARRKLALELGALYDQLIADRAEREVESINELRDKFDDFYNEIFEDNPFAKGRFITAPRIEFGGAEFQFEDAQADLDALKKTLNELNALSLSGGLADDDLQESKLEAINQFNEKYKTSIKLTANESDQVDELSKAYDDLRKSIAKSNSERRKQNIFQFSRGIQERGQEDPFVTAIEENQRKFIEANNAAEKAELTRIQNARNARILLIQQSGALEADKALQINIANAEFDKEKEEAEIKFFKRRQERIEKDNKAIEANNDAQLKVIDEQRAAEIQALEDIGQAVLDFTATFIDAQIQQTEAAIAQQQRRVDAAKEIADKGNAALLKAEQERLDNLNRQRATFVRQQQSLAAVEIAFNSAIAVAKAATEPGAPLTIVAILAAMAVGFAQARAQAKAASTFAKGDYTSDGHQFQEAGTVHKGEFVMNAQRTRQYRPLLEAIHSGRHPELAKSVNEKVFVINSKSTDERLERIERAIMGQKGLQLSIDERGINGIVSRINYKNQRINNRAR